MPIEVFYGKIPAKDKDGHENLEYGYMLLITEKNGPGGHRLNICSDTAGQLMGDLGALMRKVKQKG